MKKVLITLCAIGLAGCAQTATTSNTSLSACLTQKAYNAYADGTLAQSNITTLAKSIATECIKSLALEKAGLNTEAVNATSALLTTLNAKQ